ncbi:uncharacterized protein LOC9660323 [Selaginella moellendorffii]|uniref:uncharacterized protein LOC9660323 n=1 Tax=Selaginella moellendorffii TaxID=88036 RepID=UPI000D1CE347|nr:uncharacterized protein LOC9660323 [Selaginella moellendorffii]|eukprot:XP_024529909.1 uncharacterized protein LOC9660323 [Selaginella moellendorffii]
MKEMVDLPPRLLGDTTKCVDGELPVIMPTVLLPPAPKFKWGDFEEEEEEAAAAVEEEAPSLPAGGDKDESTTRAAEEEEEAVATSVAEEDQRVSSPSAHNVGEAPVDMDNSVVMETFRICARGAPAAPAPAESGGEKKERFRHRLWCYLFENLNRAIDELYFLCELECDMEQIHEALLVFNEAGLDFSELKARVGNFETLKKKKAGSGQAMDSSDATKVEQRPHAIAWEVRRMASSPRRADILSLSLEAFKKVHNGTSSKQHESTHHTSRRSAVRFLSFEQDTMPVVNDNAAATEEREEKQALAPHGKGQELHKDVDKVAAAAIDVKKLDCPPCKEDVKPSQAGDHDASPRPLRCDGKVSSNPAALEAWKEKRNWEDILSSPLGNVPKASASPGGGGRKSTERGRVLHDKLMSPERKKKSPMEMKKEVDEKQARATRIRRELENERALRLQRTTEKLNRVSEWQAVRSTKLREGMHARQQRGESRHEAHLAQIARRASDESSKVSEVRFITSLNEENKKLSLQQKLQDSEVRRAERLQSLRIKQKEDVAREEAAMERRKLLEAERLQRIADTQRKKEEAQARREEERKAASAAREARAVEQVRKKEVRAKAQEEEVELLRQKLAERLRESALRRKIYLEQIRERAVMDTREQGSPLSRRPSSREGGQAGRAPAPLANDAPPEVCEMRLVGPVKFSPNANAASTTTASSDGHHLKKRIKKIRQRLTTRRFDFVETPAPGVESSSRSKLGRWVQELQRLQQARKAGASATVQIIAEIIKHLDGKEAELHVARHTGLVDFIATALPASHTSKPEASQTTVALLKLLVVLLTLPANRSYFLARNLLPPLVPILSTALENYSSVGCSASSSTGDKLVVDDKFNAVGEVLEDLLKCVTHVMGHSSLDERQLQMQDDLVELIVACDIIHRLRNLFALFDRPQVEGAPFPPPVLLGLKLLDTLTRGKTLTAAQSPSSMAAQFFYFQKLMGMKRPAEVQELPFDELESNRHPSDCASSCSEPAEDQLVEADRTSKLDAGTSNRDELRRPSYASKSVGFLLVAIAETGMVGLPSLLTAVLLQSNPRAASTDQALPLNFEEVATSVLRVLNNTACLDLSLVQNMLAMPDLKMEFFHLVSFLLSYCTGKWRTTTDQVASLLLETLLLLGYFALLHTGNQAVLRWGKSPTILHKICDLPFAFFSDAELTPILVGTLLAACYGSERNRDVIQQELSMELVLSVLRSSRGQTESSKAGIQSAEAMLNAAAVQQQVVRRMDVITEECDEEMQHKQQQLPGATASTEDRNLDDFSEVTSGRRSVVASKNGIKAKKVQRPRCQECNRDSLVFLLENRFPSSLWDNAIDFFSIR